MSSCTFVLGWLGERMSGWAWAKPGNCSKCSLLDSYNIKELFSLEGLQALLSLFYCLDKFFIGAAVLQNWPRIHINSPDQHLQAFSLSIALGLVNN